MLDLSKLNKEQRKAVEAPDGPVLILAGAGSGKTSVLTYRIAYLINKGIEPKNIMAVTFTNKAAGEMKRRLIDLVGESALSIWSGTFHSICVRILKMYSHHIGIDNSFNIFDDSDSKKLVKEAIKRVGNQELDDDITLSSIEKMKTKLITSSRAIESAETYIDRQVANVYEVYENLLRENNALDFDDLIMKTVQLLQRHPQTRSTIQNMFRHVLVDEYQDTNRSQYEFLKIIASRHKNIFAVGDIDQSIYGFRGANIDNIINFERDYEDAQVVRLEQNYRSTVTIIEASNHLIKNNEKRREKNLWTENPKGDKIHIQNCFSDADESIFLADTILRNKVEKDMMYSDFAILYRVNSQSRSIETEFINRNIPYIIVGGISFYQRMEIKDLLAYMKLIVNPHDSLSFKRIVNTPRRSIGDTTVERIEEFANDNEINMIEASRRVEEIDTLKARAKSSVLNFVSLYDDLVDKTKDMSITNATKYILEKSGYMDFLRKQRNDEAEGRIENLKEFVNIATEHDDETSDSTLDEFLQKISLLSDIDEIPDEVDAVKLMTIHGSKGLEFPYVFVVGMEENLLPHQRSLSDENEIEEERRLFYVAVTRAEKNLFLSYCDSRHVYGEPRSYMPSRFLYEIPRELIEEGNSFNNVSEEMF